MIHLGIGFTCGRVAAALSIIVALLLLGFEAFPAAEVPALDRKSTRLNSSHIQKSRMPSSA